MKHQFIIALALLTVAPLNLSAQRKEKPAQEVVALAIGARRTAVFERSKRAYKIKIDGPNGESIEETIPSGIPLEVAGKENEYVPYQLYAKNKRREKKIARFSIGLNSFSPVVKLSRRQSLTLYKRRAIPQEGGETKYKLEDYATSNSIAGASHLLVTLVKNFKEKEGWAKPLVKVFDTSPSVFGKDTCFVYNSSPFQMQILFAGKEPISLAPFTQKYVANLAKDKYGASPYKITLIINGKKESMPTGALQGAENSRYYIFTFVDPRKGVIRRGDMITFSEQVPVVKDQAKANPEAETDSSVTP